MKAYIINNPQLQSLQKRIGGFFVLIMCWLMWAYLLYPLFTLSGWLLGDKKLVTEMRWFGGYKSLLQLMEIYAITLGIIALLWVVWVLYHYFRKQALLTAAESLVTDAQLSTFFEVDLNQITQSRQVAAITVYFDDHGKITGLKPTTSP